MNEKLFKQRLHDLTSQGMGEAYALAIVRRASEEQYLAILKDRTEIAELSIKINKAHLSLLSRVRGLFK